MRVRMRPALRPRTVFALAVVGNLFLAGGLALAVFPVETSEAALTAYDRLPPWAAEALGDAPEQTSDGTSLSAAGPPERGPLGEALEGFLREAVQDDPAAQADLPLFLSADAPSETWWGHGDVTVGWTHYGGPVTYRAWLTATGSGPDTSSPPAAETVGTDTMTVPVGEGRWDLHVQASYGTETGTLETVHGLWVDPSAPAPPAIDPVGEDGTVDDYAFVVTWQPTQDLSGIRTYHLERSTDGENWTEVASVAPDARLHEERNVPNGDYHYRVRAENGAGVVSAPSGPVTVTVDARGGLAPPGPGDWDYGVHATYDSLLHVYPIDDPSRYLDLDDRVRDDQGRIVRFGTLDGDTYRHYTDDGWGVETDNATLVRIVNEVVGDETNTLEIGKALFAWLFDATDYDFDKFNSPSGGDFQRAGETLDRGLGICGDLTALYITVMRIAGVPARPVHGYLLNQNATGGGNGLAIGGFHMWAEIYVGGDDDVGEGWLPVDVSGVTGSFEPKHLDIYFGINNPDYLQLGIQHDLGDDDLPLTDQGEEPMENRWNIWANLRWSYKDTGGAPPELLFRAETDVQETRAESAWMWFDPATHARKVCPAEDLRCGDGFRFYYPDLKLRSVRMIDYGATVQWDDDRIDEVQVLFKFPEETAPSQVTMWTPYEKTTSCRGVVASPEETTDGFLRWTVDRSSSPCRA